MAPSYPELATDFDRIAAIALRRGGGVPPHPRRPARRIFDTAVGDGQAGRRARRCPGDQAFQLHDTYGFPIDLTLEMAAEQGLQRRRARASAG